MAEVVIRKGHPEWERLYSKWKASKDDAGWLVFGSEQYRVIALDDDSIIFVAKAGLIDGMYGSLTQGVPE